MYVFNIMSLFFIQDSGSTERCSIWESKRRTLHENMSLKIDNKQHRDFKVDSDQSLIATVAIILTNIYIFIFLNYSDFRQVELSIYKLYIYFSNQSMVMTITRYYDLLILNLIKLTTFICCFSLILILLWTW